MDADALDGAFRSGAYHRLLGDLTRVPAGYRRDVAEAKRVVEWRDIHPHVREELRSDPGAALKRIGVSLRPDHLRALLDPDAIPTLEAAIRRGPVAGYLRVAALHHVFGLEIMAECARIRQDASSSHPALAAWRARQIRRTIFELGHNMANFLVHAPTAFELARGCSVGCWFCGIDAQRLEQTWPWTDENAALFQGALEAVHDLMGDCAKYGFCYWATDPFDNPDYERFVEEFQRTLGYCPHTTTALPNRSVERTRRFLQMTRSLDSLYDNFSILTVKALEQTHAAFSAEETLRVICLPKNREAVNFRKFYAGRARKFAQKRPQEVMPADRAATISCVSGFLFNMVDHAVKLITPCKSSDRWPLGYWVIDEGTFQSAAELRALLQKMVDRNVHAELPPDARVGLHREAVVEVMDEVLVVKSDAFTYRFASVPATLAEYLRRGEYTSSEIADALRRRLGVPESKTLDLLATFFQQGVLDEDPAKLSIPTA